MTMKMTAATIGWPTRLIALLIADASPAFRVGADDISVDVRGATTIVIPAPNTSIAGRTSTSVDAGGTNDAGSEMSVRHGADVDGMRASQSMPPAMSNGPT